MLRPLAALFALLALACGGETTAPAAPIPTTPAILSGSFGVTFDTTAGSPVAVLMTIHDTTSTWAWASGATEYDRTHVYNIPGVGLRDDGATLYVQGWDHPSDDEVWGMYIAWDDFRYEAGMLRANWIRSNCSLEERRPGCSTTFGASTWTPTN